VAAAIGGVVAVGAAVAWQAWAVPALVRFPTDLDLHPRYEGSFTLFVDPGTAAPLSSPASSALAIDRTVAARPELSTHDEVVVRETIALDVAGRSPLEQIHQYVMDRRTAANLDGEEAWAYEDTSRLDRTGAYWVSLPRGSDGTAPITVYKDEIGAAFDMLPTGVTERTDGLTLVGYRGSGTSVPVTEAYLRSLDAAQPLPRALTFEQLRPALVAAGVPIDDVLAALARVAAPEDLAQLATMTAQPIPLQYVDTFEGNVLVDPRTGAIVDVTSIVERIGARPSGDALPPLLTILDRYRSEPAVAAAIAALGRLASEPIPVFEYRYSQTDASVHEIAAWVGHQRDRLDLAERTVPLTLAGVGAALLLVAAGLGIRAWRRARP
jgi:hypothetical protein